MKVNWHNQRVYMDQLVDAGVIRLRRFGFVHVTRDNILTDEVYRFFLIRLVESLKGKDKQLDEQIDFFCKTIRDDCK